jgi:hypothetical protein
MTALAAYHIFKQSDGETLVWIEAAPDVNTANARIKDCRRVLPKSTSYSISAPNR